MAFDQRKIGQLTAELMEYLDEQFDEDSEFGDLLIISEILGPRGSMIIWRATNPRTHINLGLVSFTEKLMQPVIPNPPGGSE